MNESKDDNLVGFERTLQRNFQKVTNTNASRRFSLTMISRCNHERNLVKVALVVQKVEKGVPLTAVIIQIGNIAHQDWGLDSLGVVSKVI